MTTVVDAPPRSKFRHVFLDGAAGCPCSGDACAVCPLGTDCPHTAALPCSSCSLLFSETSRRSVSILRRWSNARHHPINASCVGRNATAYRFLFPSCAKEATCLDACRDEYLGNGKLCVRIFLLGRPLAAYVSVCAHIAFRVSFCRSCWRTLCVLNRFLVKFDCCDLKVTHWNADVGSPQQQPNAFHGSQTCCHQSLFCGVHGTELLSSLISPLPSFSLTFHLKTSARKQNEKPRETIVFHSALA